MYHSPNHPHDIPITPPRQTFHTPRSKPFFRPCRPRDICIGSRWPQTTRTPRTMAVTVKEDTCTCRSETRPRPPILSGFKLNSRDPPTRPGRSWWWFRNRTTCCKRTPPRNNPPHLHLLLHDCAFPLPRIDDNPRRWAVTILRKQGPIRYHHNLY